MNEDDVLSRSGSASGPIMVSIPPAPPTLPGVPQEHVGPPKTTFWFGFAAGAFSVILVGVLAAVVVPLLFVGSMMLDSGIDEVSTASEPYPTATGAWPSAGATGVLDGAWQGAGEYNDGDALTEVHIDAPKSSVALFIVGSYVESDGLLTNREVPVYVDGATRVSIDGVDVKSGQRSAALRSMFDDGEFPKGGSIGSQDIHVTYRRVGKWLVADTVNVAKQGVGWAWDDTWGE